MRVFLRALLLFLLVITGLTLGKLIAIYIDSYTHPHAVGEVVGGLAVLTPFFLLLIWAFRKVGSLKSHDGDSSP